MSINRTNDERRCLVGGALEDREQYPGDIKLTDIHRLMDLYFMQRFVMYSHLHNSFDKFLDDDIPSLLTRSSNIFFEKMTKDKIYRYKFVFENIAIKPPMIDADDEILFPSVARVRDMSYSSKLVATVKQIQEIVDIATDSIVTRQIGDTEHEYPIAKIPIMVRTKYCALNLRRDNESTECDMDPGGYFIINGSEKSVMTIERIIDNTPLIFKKKDTTGITYVAQINSKSPVNDSIQMLNLRMRKDGSIVAKMPIISEIPVFILMRALGVESDRDIINYTVGDVNDNDMINLVRISLESSVTELGVKILTQEDALAYLVNKVRVGKRYKYSETDKNLKIIEKRLQLLTLLKTSFLPHITIINDDLRNKGYFLGYMINKLYQCYLGRAEVDDRDSFVNKRLETPGALLFELFKQAYKKMLNECNKFFAKRDNNENPPSIINQIKPNVIEQALKAALSVGVFGKNKGVAQMLARLSTVQTLTSLRRVNSPSTDASNNKLTSPRQLHSSSIGYICFVETPEGHKIGMVKNLAMMGNITISLPSQTALIKSLIIEKIRPISSVPSYSVRNYTKVFLNGEWLGLTDEPRVLYNYLKQKKLNGDIDMHTGIIHEIKNELDSKELKIYSDGGRLFRPLLRVDQNGLLLNKKHIESINLSFNSDPKSIKGWNDFLIRYPGVIEYVDVNEQSHCMLSVFPADIIKMQTRKNDSAKLVTSMVIDNKQILNRYDDWVYVNYTHCEIHPSMMLGIVANNIPFMNSQPGPRNVYQYSQSRHAMGIFATNWKDRLDIGYILYNTQRPLISSRNAKYVGTDIVPAGENVIMAIMCYTGYNQEDSVLLSKSAIDRGLFRSTSIKKMKSEVKKNQTTSENDVFTNPDPNKVITIKNSSYDKLNDDGYAPQETTLTYGDVVMGKVSPIQPVGNSIKTFKDSSEVYKDKPIATVDRVWTNIENDEGYPIRKVRTRSERIPVVGDKLCSRAAQKGTIGLILPQSDMPFTEEGISPDVIMNSNALPSRMTSATLIEALVGKVSAIRGHETDGTSYRILDIDEVKNILEELGYHRSGQEYLYNGMTGEKLQSMIFIGPTYYQRLKHMVNDKIHCLTMDHEVLTSDGWKTYDELDMNSEIAILKDNMLVYEKPIDLLYFPTYDGHIYTVTSDDIDLCVTDNHRMWASIVNNRFELIEASNLVGVDVMYQKDAVTNYSECSDYTDQQLTMFAAWFLHNVEVLPKWVWKLSMRQCRIIIDIIGGYRYTDKLVLDSISQLCLHAGWSATIVDDCIIVNKHNNRPVVNSSNLTKYTGPVFCLQVSSEVFYVRRNGKSVWTGNSRARGPLTILTKQCPEGRVRDGGLRCGEMERDAIISHGLAIFLKERMMDLADLYNVLVCRICGLFAQRKQTKNPKAYTTDKDVYHCPSCKNKNLIDKVSVPYAFKLMIQELLSMNIVPRIRT